MALDLATWAWPQWTYAAIIALNLVCGALLDGEPKTGAHRFSVSLVGSALGFGLLWAGGFWGNL